MALGYGNNPSIISGGQSFGENDYRNNNFQYPNYNYPHYQKPMPLPAQVPPMMGQPMMGQPMMGQPMMGQPTAPAAIPSGSFVTPTGGGATVPTEESYVENILRLNRGKKATFYMTYENNKEWNAKIFTGVIEAAGRDHIIISDPSTGMRFLLLTLNLDYVTFNEPIAYQYPFQGGTITNTTPMGTATVGTVTPGR